MERILRRGTKKSVSWWESLEGSSLEGMTESRYLAIYLFILTGADVMLLQFLVAKGLDSGWRLAVPRYHEL